MTATEREQVQLAMEELENCPTGGIGDDGPTLAELDAHVEATGQSWECDAVYHTCQRAWRILQEATK